MIGHPLDECLNQLNGADRAALVLRFLKRQDLRAVGAALGIGEDAAQKRVSRALEKLRGVLSRRGVALTAAALTSVLATEAVTAAPAGLATGSNEFEIVYQGSQNDLTNIPPRRVALIRERQPWLTPDGKWTRVYGNADGSSSTVESDDNFQSWDAQHIIPPQVAGQ